MNVEKYMRELGARARKAAVEIAKSSTATRNQALLAIRDALKAGAAQLLEATPRTWPGAEPRVWKSPCWIAWK